MNVVAATTKIAETAVDALVVGHFADSPLAGSTSELDKALGGMLTRLVEAKELTGKKLEVVTLPVPPGIAAKLVAIVGLGERGDLNAGLAYRACAAAAKAISGKERAKAAYFLGEGWSTEIAAAAVS